MSNELSTPGATPRKPTVRQTRFPKRLCDDFASKIHSTGHLDQVLTGATDDANQGEIPFAADCWCECTCTMVGPDDELVTPESCTPDRSCFTGFEL